MINVKLRGGELPLRATSQQCGATQNCTDDGEIASETGALGGREQSQRDDEGWSCFENSLLRALGRFGCVRFAPESDSVRISKLFNFLLCVVCLSLTQSHHLGLHRLKVNYLSTTTITTSFLVTTTVREFLSWC